MLIKLALGKETCRASVVALLLAACVSFVGGQLWRRDADYTKLIPNSSGQIAHVHYVTSVNAPLVTSSGYWPGDPSHHWILTGFIDTFDLTQSMARETLWSLEAPWTSQGQHSDDWTMYKIGSCNVYNNNGWLDSCGSLSFAQTTNRKHAVWVKNDWDIENPNDPGFDNIWYNSAELHYPGGWADDPTDLTHNSGEQKGTFYPSISLDGDYGYVYIAHVKNTPTSEYQVRALVSANEGSSFTDKTVQSPATTQPIHYLTVASSKHVNTYNV